MKTTLYEIGQFLKHVAAVTCGVFIANQFIEMERVKTFDNSRRELCAKVLTIEDPNFDQIEANCKRAGF